MKRFLLLLAALFILSAPAFAETYIYGPALTGSYNNVTIATTTITNVGTLVGGATAGIAKRDMIVFRNPDTWADIYVGAGSTSTTVGCWRKIKTRETYTFYLTNLAGFGKTNSNYYARVTPTTPQYSTGVIEAEIYKKY